MVEIEPVIFGEPIFTVFTIRKTAKNDFITVPFYRVIRRHFVRSTSPARIRLEKFNFRQLTTEGMFKMQENSNISTALKRSLCHPLGALRLASFVVSSAKVHLKDAKMEGNK